MSFHLLEQISGIYLHSQHLLQQTHLAVFLEKGY